MRSVIALLVAVGLAAASASGQAPKGSPQLSQEIAGYQLTLPRANQLITAMEAMTRHLVSQAGFQDRLLQSMKMTLAEQRAHLGKDPKAMAVLKQNGLTAQEYLVGVPALRMALMAAQGVKAQNLTVSPANLAFAKANLALLKPKMDAADGLLSLK